MIPTPYKVVTDTGETEVSDHKANLIAIFSFWKLYTPLHHRFTAQLQRVLAMVTLSLNYISSFLQ